METEKYYTINVLSKEPGEVEIGRLDANTGLPKGPTQKTKMALGGIAIPNFSRVWGRLEKHKVSGQLTGKIEYMRWEEEGGTLIELRYMKSASSLSKEYQDTVLKLKPRDEEGEIFLNIGVNEFKIADNKLMVELLKNHYMNADSPSRDPESRTNIFEHYDGKGRVKKRVATINERRDAENYVLLAAEKSDFAVLAKLFNLDLHQEDDLIQEELLEKMDQNLPGFLQTISEGKSKAKSLLDEATIEGFLKGADTQEVMLRGAKGKLEALFSPTRIQQGESTAAFIMDTYFEHDTFDAILKVESALQKALQTQLD